MVSKSIHISLMIWHLLKNSSFKPVFCVIGLAARFYAKVHYLFYTRLHLLPTALRLYGDTSLKRGGQWVLYYLSSFVFFSRCTFELITVIVFIGKQIQFSRNNNLENQTTEALVFYNKY